MLDLAVRDRTALTPEAAGGKKSARESVASLLADLARLYHLPPYTHPFIEPETPVKCVWLICNGISVAELWVLPCLTRSMSFRPIVRLKISLKFLGLGSIRGVLPIYPGMIFEKKFLEVSARQGGRRDVTAGLPFRAKNPSGQDRGEGRPRSTQAG